MLLVCTSSGLTATSPAPSSPQLPGVVFVGLRLLGFSLSLVSFWFR